MVQIKVKQIKEWVMDHIYGYFFIVIIPFIFIFVIFLFIYYFYSWLHGIIVVLSIIFLVLIFGPFQAKYDQNYIKTHKGSGTKEKQYAAIIFVKKYKKDPHSLFVVGVSWLIKHFYNIKQPYKVFLWIDVEKFKSIIKEEKATKTYIFGHGKRDGLYFRKDFLNYSDFKDYPKKDFVGQYHCNIGRNKKSLADYLKAKKSDATKGIRIPQFICLKFMVFYLWSSTKKLIGRK